MNLGPARLGWDEVGALAAPRGSSALVAAPQAERGIIYIASGAPYVRDAERSARSAKKQHPDLPIALFSDVPTSEPAIDMWFKVEDPHRRSKLDYLAKSPFARTLYLDADTRVIDSITEPFGLLDRYDLAGCHVENRHPVSSATARLTDAKVDPAFTGFNGGVLYYRLNDRMRVFLARWAEGYKAENAKFDQPILRRLMWEMPEIGVVAIPPEYNVRTLRGILFRSKNESTARLLHLPWYKSADSAPYRFWRTIRTGRCYPGNLVLMIRAFFM